MSADGEVLARMVDRLFGDLAGVDVPGRDGWRSIEELGLADLFRCEAEGGMAGHWRDAEPVFRLSGYHGLLLPVGETMIARKLLSQAGATVAEGPIAIADGRAQLSAGGALTGRLQARTTCLAGGWLLATIADGDPCVLVETDHACHREAVANIAGEARDSFRFDGAPVQRIRGVDTETILAAFAILRTAQIAGALAACLERSIRYSQERAQFGRELRKFQAIQHQIALLAEEAAAVAAASASAAAAMDRGGAAFEISCAKLRANQASGASALIAHQVHGAIGITEEFGLHRFTRRLWAWRSEFGNDRFWAQRLGKIMLADNKASPWHLITARGMA